MSANATGTPTTNLSLPKFNTASDAPNGRGVNEMMDAIDTLLVNGAQVVTRPAGIASGEVPVWNGSAWVRSSTTRVGSSSLNDAAVVIPSLSSGNNDLAAPIAPVTWYRIGGVGGAVVRSIGAAPSDGYRVFLRNEGAATTVAHNLAGGSGQTIQMADSNNRILGNSDAVELIYLGNVGWVEKGRAIAAYTPYTATWSSTGTQPTIGNGTIAGGYLYTGRIVLGYAWITLGSTSTVGTGIYSISAPLTIAGPGVAPCGTFSFYDSSAGQGYSGHMHNSNSVAALPVFAQSPGVDVAASATVPVVPAVNDAILVNWQYIS